jgi:hypothetical protein
VPASISAWLETIPMKEPKLTNNNSKTAKTEAKTTDQNRELTMKELDEVSGGLQSEDRLGNTQIQTLMSNYNDPPTVKR